MFKIEMKLEGAKELAAALRALPDSLRKGVVERALVDAGKPIAADAASRAPVKTGRLRRSIAASTQLSKRQRRGRGRSKDLAEAFIGPRRFYLGEFGTGPRHQKKTGRFTGQMPARPILRPAWEAGKDRALDAIGEALWAQLEKAATRLGRKAAKFRR